jgi:hypothetical protein
VKSLKNDKELEQMINELKISFDYISIKKIPKITTRYFNYNQKIEDQLLKINKEILEINLDPSSNELSSTELVRQLNFNNLNNTNSSVINNYSYTENTDSIRFTVSRSTEIERSIIEYQSNNNQNIVRPQINEFNSSSRTMQQENSIVEYFSNRQTNIISEFNSEDKINIIINKIKTNPKFRDFIELLDITVLEDLKYINKDEALEIIKILFNL